MKIEELKARSHWLRKELFEMVVRTKKGHFPSSSSITEVVVALYYGGYLRVDPKNPRHPDRDRLFVSKGHAGMAIYPILEDLGFVPKGELAKFTKADGLFRFYPDTSIPGVEAISGSLGHGLGIAAGHAIAAKREGRKYRTFAVISDGECYEGSTWETAMFVAHQQLDNLVAIVDRNGCCILDHTEKCVRQEPFEDKWAAFGWHVLRSDGHSFAELTRALDEALSGRITGKPIAIISRGVKGKGVSFMENKPGWHNRMPTDAEIQQARTELATNCITS
jgi:transketolase